MRKALLFLWFLLPVAGAAYHYGPGQDRLRSDRAAQALDRARDAASEARRIAAEHGDTAAKSRWSDAEKAYTEALELLPNDRAAESRALRLERAKAQMFVGKLPDARGDLEDLVDELAADPGADPSTLADARGALANAQYYMTWLMRLEGAPRGEWEPEIEASRQNYALLAQAAEASHDGALALRTKEDLEASIRLERMELKDLQGMPLPSQ
jgi:hypothetical protein